MASLPPAQLPGRPVITGEGGNHQPAILWGDVVSKDRGGLWAKGRGLLCAGKSGGLPEGLSGQRGEGEHERPPPCTLGRLTWERAVIGAGAAGPGAPEPLGVVVYPAAGLLGEIEVAVES